MIDGHHQNSMVLQVEANTKHAEGYTDAFMSNQQKGTHVVDYSFHRDWSVSHAQCIRCNLTSGSFLLVETVVCRLIAKLYFWMTARRAFYLALVMHIIKYFALSSSSLWCACVLRSARPVD